jgi:hypothetical protein
MAQSRQSAKLFLLSSELGLPHPLIRRRVFPPPGSVGRGTVAGDRGFGFPNSDEGTYSVVLFICTYFVVNGIFNCLKFAMSKTAFSDVSILFQLSLVKTFPSEKWNTVRDNLCLLNKNISC